MLDAAYRSPEGTRSNLWTTVQTAIAPLLGPTARATFCPPAGEGIDLEAFLKARAARSTCWYRRSRRPTSPR